MIRQFILLSFKKLIAHLPRVIHPPDGMTDASVSRDNSAMPQHSQYVPERYRT